MNKEEIQKKAFSKIDFEGINGIEMSMGTGKTRLGLNYCTHLLSKDINRKILIVYPNNSIKESWKEEIEKIGFKYKTNLTFSTYLSVKKYNQKDFYAVICDESHSITESSYKFLKEYKRILGLTGTPITNTYSDKFYYFKSLFPAKFTYLISEAVEDEILNNFNLHLHYLELSKTKDIQVNFNKGSFYTSEYDQYRSLTKKLDTATGYIKDRYVMSRLLLLKNFKTKLNYVKKLVKTLDNKTIVFTPSIEFANDISDCRVHSKEKNSKECLASFMRGDTKLLSCVEQLSMGITIPNLKSAIVMHSYASEVRLPQKLGRILRLNPDEVSDLHILVYKDTKDSEWLNEAIKLLNPKTLTIHENK